MIQVSSIRLPLSSTKEDAVAAATSLLGLLQEQITKATVCKISVDARHKQVQLVYSVAIELTDKGAEAAFAGFAPSVSIKQKMPLDPTRGTEPLNTRPVICGFGPAGLFCGLLLAKYGFKPIILERGPALPDRVAAVEAFRQTGLLCENANVQFGEGGAGTFSDGKLTTRIGDTLCDAVTEVLLAHGAPPEIEYANRPHIGTDRLRDVIVSIRKEIVQLGGEMRFSEQMTDLVAENGRLMAVKTDKETLPTKALVLAVGHSARDIFALLRKADVAMEVKGFSVGFRIEHLQAEIDRALYRTAAGHPALPPGEYALSARANGRGVYTFCMCPGGTVVAAASEENGVVTNGMSMHARDGKNANSALVVSVLPEDFSGSPEQAIAFQRRLEGAAFRAGGGGYAAPMQTVGQYLKTGHGVNRVQPSYERGVKEADLAALLPKELSGAIAAALPQMAQKLAGFAADDSLLTGIETRTSSPVRVLRSEGYESISLGGLYPCGEGAGYAGGIMSAAVDGLRVAIALIERYTPAF